MALPCASAKRSRLLPEVYDDCSSVACKLSRRISWRPAALVDPSHVKKWSTPSCAKDLHHLHFTVSTLLSPT